MSYATEVRALNAAYVPLENADKQLRALIAYWARKSDPLGVGIIEQLTLARQAVENATDRVHRAVEVRG